MLLPCQSTRHVQHTPLQLSSILQHADAEACVKLARPVCVSRITYTMVHLRRNEAIHAAANVAVYHPRNPRAA